MVTRPYDWCLALSGITIYCNEWSVPLKLILIVYSRCRMTEHVYYCELSAVVCVIWFQWGKTKQNMVILWCYMMWWRYCFVKIMYDNEKWPGALRRWMLWCGAQRYGMWWREFRGYFADIPQHQKPMKKEINLSVPLPVRSLLDFYHLNATLNKT